MGHPIEFSSNDITADFLTVLNSTLACNPEAFGDLCTKGVQGEDFKKHPDVLLHSLQGSQPTLRLLGVLNGILDRLGCPQIVAEYTEGIKQRTPWSKPVRFRKVLDNEEFKRLPLSDFA